MIASCDFYDLLWKRTGKKKERDTKLENKNREQKEKRILEVSFQIKKKHVKKT